MKVGKRAPNAASIDSQSVQVASHSGVLVNTMWVKNFRTEDTCLGRHSRFLFTARSLLLGWSALGRR